MASAYRVLIVDADPNLLSLYSRLLTKAGFLIDTANDGNEALKYIFRFNPDLVLMDLELPGLDGAEILSNMNKKREFRTIPVVALGEQRNKSTRKMIKGLGLEHYFLKTEDSPASVVARITQILKGREPRQINGKKSTGAKVIKLGRAHTFYSQELERYKNLVSEYPISNTPAIMKGIKDPLAGQRGSVVKLTSELSELKTIINLERASKKKIIQVLNERAKKQLEDVKKKLSRELESSLRARYEAKIVEIRRNLEDEKRALEREVRTKERLITSEDGKQLDSILQTIGSLRDEIGQKALTWAKEIAEKEELLRTALSELGWVRAQMKKKPSDRMTYLPEEEKLEIVAKVIKNEIDQLKSELSYIQYIENGQYEELGALKTDKDFISDLLQSIQEEKKPTQRKPYTILVVEDDMLLSHVYKKKLSMLGYNTIVAGNGRTGLERAKNSHPDLIVLDIILPDINGLEVLRRLRASNIDIPTIVISNAMDQNIKSQAFALGAKDFLVKVNTTPKLFVEKIKKYLK